MTDKFFEDLNVGDIYKTAKKTISLEEIIAFAKEFDPQPMHIDPVAAKNSFFGELVGSGWHTLTATMRLMVDSKPLGNTSLIGMEVNNVRLTEPLKPNSTLSASMEILNLKESKKGGRGYVTVKITTFCDERPVCTQEWVMLIPTKEK